MICDITSSSIYKIHMKKRLMEPQEEKLMEWNVTKGDEWIEIKVLQMTVRERIMLLVKRERKMLLVIKRN